MCVLKKVTLSNLITYKSYKKNYVNEVMCQNETKKGKQEQATHIQNKYQ